jgi:hypothetical protein
MAQALARLSECEAVPPADVSIGSGFFPPTPVATTISLLRRAGD